MHHQIEHVIVITLWLFNIAMENGTFIYGLPMKKVGELLFFSEFCVFFDLRGGACLLVPWRQPVYSLVSIHFPEF